MSARTSARTSDAPRTVEVRAARADDAPAVAALMQEAHVFHAAALPHVFQSADATVATADDVADLVARDDRVMLVASLDGDTVAYAHAEIVRAPATPYKRAASELHVHAMAVAERARRAGVGRALLAALRAAAAERGLAALTLDVYAFNDAALAFYLREGFTPLRTRMSARVGEP